MLFADETEEGLDLQLDGQQDAAAQRGDDGRWRRILLHFADPAGREDAAARLRQRLTPDTKAIWHPAREEFDPTALSNEDALLLEQMQQQDFGEEMGDAFAPDWQRHWQSMPAYETTDMEPKQTVVVHFETRADRADFLRALGDEREVANAIYLWHPRREIMREANKHWVTQQRVDPAYPVYVPTKGRYATPYTIKALERMRVPYYAVVKDFEVKLYEPVVRTGMILTLPDDVTNLVQTRNWIRRHSEDKLGARRHWQIDDNIRQFKRLHHNQKHEVRSGAFFRVIEAFSDRYDNVAVSGPHYSMFTKKTFPWPPLTLNTRVYSCSLVNNEQPHWWRDVYNDDTDLCLRALKEGWSVVLFNALVCEKLPTMRVKGGNTAIYLGAERVRQAWEAHATACPLCTSPDETARCEDGRRILSEDGRWLMADSLVRQHPDVTTITRKWGRWQHQVDYRPFRRIALRLREGVVVQQGNDEFGMTLQDAAPRARKDAAVRAPSPRHEREASGQASRGPSALSFLDLVAQERPQEPPSPQAAGPAEEPAHVSRKQPAAQPVLPEPERPAPAPAEVLLLRLKASGHEAFLKDGRLTIVRARELPDEDKVEVVRMKDELIALLTRSDVLSVGQARDLLTLDLPPAEEPHSIFAQAPQATMADFLAGAAMPASYADWRPDEPPSLDGVEEVALNFATDGLEWHAGHRPVGVTVSTLDGRLTRFMPFRFAGGNLDEEVVRRWARQELRNKRIVNSKTKFDVHMAREWGVDLEAQGCTFSDVQHTAALLDDHRKRFSIDVLLADYLPEEPALQRVDERRHHEHHAAEAAERERFTAQAVGRLLQVMRPMLKEQELEEVQAIEDAVIPAVVEMERNGALIDVELLERSRREIRVAYEALMWEVSKQAGFSFEHTAKGWERLLTHLGLPVPASFSEQKLAQIDHPLVRLGQRASQHASLLSKVYDAYPQAIDGNGILRFDVKQLASDDGGTVSGRFAIGYVQQVPNHDNHTAAFGDLWYPRRLFISATGELLEADAAQIEFRFLAHYAGNKEILAAYAKDPKASWHKLTWEMIKRYKPNQLYTHQKSFNFARQYGAKSVKLAVMMGFITEEEGNEIRSAKRWNDPRLATIQEIEAAYRRMLPEGDVLLDQASHLAMPECNDWCNKNESSRRMHRLFQHRGYVRTIKGRRSRFRRHDKFYIGLNRIIQGGGADVMKIKLAELHKARKHTGLLMRLTIHDAVIGDVQQPETFERVEEILNAQSVPLKVPILWELGRGRTWADCKG